MSKPHAAAERAARTIYSANAKYFDEFEDESERPEREHEMAQQITAEYAEAVEALQTIETVASSCGGEVPNQFFSAIARPALARVRGTP
jgi:hypothetical protein